MPQTTDDRRPAPEPEDVENIQLSDVRAFIEFNKNEGDEGQQSRKKISKEVYDYYWGTRQLELLTEEMRERFPKTVTSRRKHVENVSRMIVDSISVVYKQPPDRVVGADIDSEASDAEIEALDAERAEIQSTYDRMVNDAKLDMQFQKLERYVNFDRTDLIWVRWMDDKLQTSVVPQFLFDVMLDEDGRLAAVVLSSYLDEDHIKEQKYFVWTKENFWKLDDQLNVMPNEENPDNVNPDGLIPFVLVRQVVPDDGIYCDADLNLSNTNLNVNLLLSDALHLSEFQVHGQLVGQNVDFSTSVEWGPESLVTFEAKDPDHAAELKFLKPDADFDGLFETVNRILAGFARSRGLPENTFSTTKSAVESGVAIKIRNAPLIEIRESLEEFYREVESGLLEVMVPMWNLRVDAGEIDADKLPDDLEVKIVYNRPDDAFESMSDKVTNMLALKAQGLIKPTEIIMAMKPSFNEKDAEKYLEEVAAEMERLRGASGLFDSFDPTRDPARTEPQEPQPEDTGNRVAALVRQSLGNSDNRGRGRDR